MSVPKTNALPLGYTLYSLFWTIEWGEEEGKRRDFPKEIQAMQGHGDIASKQQDSPFRTDYNKVATLIERN
ncbi:hypothetical protein Ancab_037834, partial [Ancistrocladus abbreviatus]